MGFIPCLVEHVMNEWKHEFAQGQVCGMCVGTEKKNKKNLSRSAGHNTC